MGDCNNCFSAGSVNRWGYCEICGEEHQESAVVSWVLRSEVKSGARFQVFEGGAGHVDNNVYSAELDKLTAS
jgi:hypothetical protein